MPESHFGIEAEEFPGTCSFEAQPIVGVSPLSPTGNCGVCVTPVEQEVSGCVCSDCLRHLELPSKMTLRFPTIDDTEAMSGVFAETVSDQQQQTVYDVSYADTDFTGINQIEVYKNPASPCGWIGGEVTYEEEWLRIRRLENSNPPVYEIDGAFGSESPPPPYLKSLLENIERKFRPEEWTPRPASAFDTWYADDAGLQNGERWIVDAERIATWRRGYILTVSIRCENDISGFVATLTTGGKWRGLAHTTHQNGFQDWQILTGAATQAQFDIGFPGHAFGMGKAGAPIDCSNDGPWCATAWGSTDLNQGGTLSPIMTNPACLSLN